MAVPIGQSSNPFPGNLGIKYNRRQGIPGPFPAKGKACNRTGAFSFNRFTCTRAAYGIPDFGRFSLRTAHAVLRSNLPQAVAQATGHGFTHTDGRSGRNGLKDGACPLDFTISGRVWELVAFGRGPRVRLPTQPQAQTCVQFLRVRFAWRRYRLAILLSHRLVTSLPTDVGPTFWAFLCAY
jgi:hypothetical protein